MKSLPHLPVKHIPLARLSRAVTALCPAGNLSDWSQQPSPA
jgi:hypothetical protein